MFPRGVGSLWVKLNLQAFVDEAPAQESQDIPGHPYNVISPPTPPDLSCTGCKDSVPHSRGSTCSSSLLEGNRPRRW